MADCSDIENGMSEKLYYTYWWENKLNGTMYIGSGQGKRYLNHKTSSSNTNLKKDISQNGLEHFAYDIFQYYNSEVEARLAEQDWFRYLEEMGVKLYNIAKTVSPNSYGNTRMFDTITEKQICIYYINDEMSIYDIGKIYSCSGTTISRVLSKCNVKIRPKPTQKALQKRGENIRIFDKDIENKIVSEYKSGETSKALSKRYSCDPTTICNILKRHGIQPRRAGIREGTYKASDETKHKMSKGMKGKKRSEASKAKMSASAMGKPGTNTGKTFHDEWCDKISASLKGKQYPDKWKFDEATAMIICKQYAEDILSTDKLAKIYGCYKSAILNVLRRGGVSMRPKNTPRFSPDIEKEIYQKYKELQNYKIVGRIYKCSHTTIKRIVECHSLKEINDQ